MRGRQTLEDGDLQNPFKEVLRSPFTRRIIEFLASKHMILANLKVYDGSTNPDDHLSRFVVAANQGEWEMPVWCRMFQQTLDGPARGRFKRLPNEGASRILQRLTKWSKRRMRHYRLSRNDGQMRRVSAFMTNAKSSELSRRFLSQVPQTVTDMMKRVDDFIKFEKAFRVTKLTKGEGPDQGQKLGHRHDRPYFQPCGGDRTRHNHPARKGNVYNPYVAPRPDTSKQEMKRYKPFRGGLETLSKFPKETLATEPQLHFP
ncbi:hypothetical protein Tco_0190526 [Tanacetum coccineum]